MKKATKFPIKTATLNLSMNFPSSSCDNYRNLNPSFLIGAFQHLLPPVVVLLQLVVVRVPHATHAPAPAAVPRHRLLRRLLHHRQRRRRRLLLLPPPSNADLLPLHNILGDVRWHLGAHGASQEKGKGSEAATGVGDGGHGRLSAAMEGGLIGEGEAVGPHAAKLV